MKKFKIIENPMEFAIEILRKRKNKLDVPIACVIINRKKELISYACNETMSRNDPLAHAELLAIRKASLIKGSNYLDDLSLYVTLQPCAMCEAAIINSRIEKVFFGAYSFGFSQIYNKKKYFLEKKQFQFYGGFKERQCSKLISSFFRKLRKMKKII
tara:strand:+ start:963 stop:1433 length:471 start_codon:yes stop_codon:yes gene_type:complete